MRLSPLEAYDTLMRFARDCGEWPLRLAMHASVAQSFRPLFLHLTKLNYLPEAAADPSVESDVLLAPFCREIGAGYFDFDPRVRALLLDNLQSEYAAEGRSRLRSVAGFLIGYLDVQERSIDSTQDRLSQSYIEVQRWVALSILDPDGAAQQLAAALNRTGRTGAAVARVQIGGLVNVLAAPLLRYPQLTDYALGVQALERGEVERAQELLSGVGELQVGPVKLRTARAVLAAWNVPEKAAVAETRSAAEKRVYASCFISWGRDEESRQFVDQLARDLRFEGVDCHVDGEDFAADSSPLAGRQVLVLVNSARAESTYELSQHADEAAKAGNPIVTLSLDPPWEIPFHSAFDAVGNVDFSDGRTADQAGYTYALRQLLDLLRDQAGWRPKAPQNPWAGKKFGQDVFLSYAAADNQQGWIEKFRRDLQARLEVTRGGKTSIWGAAEFRVGASWSDEALKYVQDSAIFVAVVTPRYLASPYCRYEREQFIKGAEQSGGLFFQGHGRIFPVLLGPIEAHDLPYPLQQAHATRFPEVSTVGVSQDYLPQIFGLAYAIRDTLELFQPTPSKAATPPPEELTRPPSGGGQIYLQVDPSDIEAVSPLTRYLTEQGFSVSSPPEGYGADDRMLQACDATIVYWGSAPAQWVKMRGSDTVKYWLMQSDRPLMSVYLGPPSNSAKESFLGFPYFLVLRSSDTLDPTMLELLIRQLRPAASGD